MDAADPSRTLASVCQATWCHITDDCEASDVITIFITYFPFLRKENRHESLCSLCMHTRVRARASLIQLTNFCENWYEHFVIGPHPDIILHNFPQLVLTVWQITD
jgi:hypothetical protein